jgi:single-strand DNA-binding protein
MNSVVISGRVTKDVELRYLPSGMAIASFPLAVQEDRKNAEGGYDTNFIDVTAWGKTAEFVANHSGKGLRLIVNGRLKQEKWQDKDGANRSKISVTAEKVEPVDWTGGEN